MESMEEKVLCLMTDYKIVGIRLGILPLVMGVPDWNSLSSAPLEFEMDFWQSKVPLGMRHFKLDSKIYLCGGLKPFPGEEHLFSPIYGIPNYKIYSFDMSKLQMLSEVDSIPSPPSPILSGTRTLVANSYGGTYFLSTYSSMFSEGGLLFFDSSRTQWVKFPSPPDCSSYHDCFILRDKFYLYCSARKPIYSFKPKTKGGRQWHSDSEAEAEAEAEAEDEDDSYASYASHKLVYCFDLKSQHWTLEQQQDGKDYYHLLNSLHLRIEDQPQFVFPQITLSLSDLGIDGSVILAPSYIRLGDKHICPPKMKVRIYAFLDINQEGVLFPLRLDDPFEGIQPSFVAPPKCKFIDLGNRRVCALICGNVCTDQGSVLCISVFTLANLKLDPAGRFLCIRILAKDVFTWEDSGTPLLEAFVCQDKNTKRSNKRRKLTH